MNIGETIFSPDRVHRYTLWRNVPVTFTFDEHKRVGFVQFIGLNPSTADETNDDPTIRRCRDFASRWGFEQMCMTNLFAFRATDPSEMKKAADPIGPENDAYLITVAAAARLVVAVWGVHGSFMDRAKSVMKWLPNSHCIRHTKHGQPEHPLYLPKTLTPVPLVP